MIITPEALSLERRYYLMSSCIVPRPIAWVGTLNEDGSHNLAPYSYFNGVSATSPIIGIGIGRANGKPEKDTLRNTRRTGEIGFSDRNKTDGLRHDISVLETIFKYPDKIGDREYENGQILI